MAERPIYKVMVSSTYKELVEHRRAVIEMIVEQRMLPIVMDYDSALPGHTLITASLEKVDAADAYFGLISYRYGQTPEDSEHNQHELSLTELEFQRAAERKIPMCLFFMGDEHPVKRRAVGEERGNEDKLAAFIALAKKDRVYAEFNSVEELKTKALQSLIKVKALLDEKGQPPQAAPPAGNPRLALSNIPIAVPLHFLGRDRALADIEAALKRANGRAAISALHGLRGVGKTTLAAAYAERHRGDYRATWWIRAETEPTLRADLVGLGVRLGWVAADAKEEPALDAVKDRLRDDGEGILLVFDNAVGAADIGQYLPKGGAAQVLITSNSDVWDKIASKIEIAVWPPETGADYLIERTGRTGERDAALALSAALGGLPLAHEQAAAYCEDIGIGFADYHARFEKAVVKFLDDEEHAPDEYHPEHKAAHNIRLTVAGTFQLAIEQAAKRHPAAEPLIVNAALLAPEPIPLFLFAEGRTEFAEPFASAIEGDGLDRAVAALRAFALIDRESVPDERDPSISTDCIRLHRLVRQVAAARCESEAREQARHALIMALAAVYPDNIWRDHMMWSYARRLDGLALGLLSDDSLSVPNGAEEQAVYLLDCLASYRQRVLNAYQEAQILFERSVRMRERQFGISHAMTSQGLNNLALLFQEKGDYGAARPLFERALAIRENTLGSEHPSTALSLCNLGLLFSELGEHVRARELCERSLAIREKVYGEEHAETAESLHALGLIRQREGNFADAQHYFQRAFDIREKVCGSMHLQTAASLNRLGFVTYYQGINLAAAHALCQRALSITEAVFGAEHLEVAQSASTLALVLQAQGDLAGAQSLLERALAICEKRLGARSGKTAETANNLGMVFKENRKFAAAQIYIERALNIWIDLFGDEDPSTNTARGNLSELLLEIGQPVEALSYAQVALTAHCKALGSNHPWTKQSARITSSALLALGRAEEAAALRAKYGLTSEPPKSA